MPSGHPLGNFFSSAPIIFVLTTNLGLSAASDWMDCDSFTDVGILLDLHGPVIELTGEGVDEWSRRYTFPLLPRRVRAMLSSKTSGRASDLFGMTEPDAVLPQSNALQKGAGAAIAASVAERSSIP